MGRTRMRGMSQWAVVIAIAAGLVRTAGAGELPVDTKSALATSKYVYISSTRKDGNLGTPAEIWFLYHQGAVYVGTPPTAWRVRRIKQGRDAAKIAVGSATGPSFMATGTIVDDPDVLPVLYATFAKKYPDGWPRYEQRFRQGFKDGSRVLVKYVPRDD